MIRLLYDVERQAKELAAAERLALRQEHAVERLRELHHWLKQQRDQVLPKSPMGEAIGYALNQWQALIRYAGDGDLAIDNNVAERAIRPLVVPEKLHVLWLRRRRPHCRDTLQSHRQRQAPRHGPVRLPARRVGHHRLNAHEPTRPVPARPLATAAAQGNCRRLIGSDATDNRPRNGDHRTVTSFGTRPVETLIQAR
jgi:hypothetical protein